MIGFRKRIDIRRRTAFLNYRCFRVDGFIHEAGGKGVGDGEYGCGSFASIGNGPTGPAREEVRDRETEANRAGC